MHHENKGIATSSFKKVKAKKHYIPASIRPRGEETSSKKLHDSVEMLNMQVFGEISTLVGSNKNANLSHIIAFYNTEVEKVIPCHSTSFKIPESQINGYPYYFKYKFPTNKYFTDSFLALASIFEINPLVDKDDMLSSLLDQGCEIQETGGFAYISIGDVVRSRGNAIHGPRREDIGRFNRKLFETYSKELESTLQPKLVVNLKFHPSLDPFLGNDKVLSSDYVSVILFDGPRKIPIGEHVLIIHKNNNEEKFCTIKNETFSLLTGMESANFHSALSSDKKKINLMYLPTFSLYSIEFLCENASIFVYNSFFKNCQSCEYSLV